MPERFDKLDALKYIKASGSELPFNTSTLSVPVPTIIYYSDINNMFSLDGDEVVVIEYEAVNRQITNILSTPLGSESFEPTFGSLLPYRLFQTVSPVTAWVIENDTIEALKKWMGGRITVNGPSSYVRPLYGDPDNEGYEINLTYSINRTGKSSNYNAAILR